MAYASLATSSRGGLVSGSCWVACSCSFISFMFGLLSVRFPEWFQAHDYFVDSRLIKTTSRTITSTAITVQSHTPPPIHPSIHPYVWFIIKLLSLRCEQPIRGHPRSCAVAAG